MEGTIDFRRRVSELTMMVGEVQSEPLRVRFATDGVLYMSSPSKPSLEGKWFRFSGEGSADFFSAVIPVPGVRDPRGVVELLEFAKGSIEIVGNENVGGAETTHYRAKLDAARILSRSSSGENADLIEAYRAIDELPLEVWIDEAGRARRLVLDLPAVRDDPAAKLTIEFSDFGVAVDASPPPPEDVLAEDPLSLEPADESGSTRRARR